MSAKVPTFDKASSKQQKYHIMLFLTVSPMSYFTRISVLGLEEQGKPICVPNERGRQHQHAQSCFLSMASALPGLLFGSDLLRLPSCAMLPAPPPAMLPGTSC